MFKIYKRPSSRLDCSVICLHFDNLWYLLCYMLRLHNPNKSASLSDFIAAAFASREWKNVNKLIYFLVEFQIVWVCVTARHIAQAGARTGLAMMRLRLTLPLLNIIFHTWNEIVCNYFTFVWINITFGVQICSVLSLARFFLHPSSSSSLLAHISRRFCFCQVC